MAVDCVFLFGGHLGSPWLCLFSLTVYLFVLTGDFCHGISSSASWVPLRVTEVSSQALPGISWQFVGGVHEVSIGVQKLPGLGW